MRERTLLPLKLPKAQISQRNNVFRFVFCGAIPIFPITALQSRIPDVLHREQIHPYTHFTLPMCHIRKSPTCYTQPSMAHSRFPNVSHQVQILPSTHIFRPIHHIRRSPPCLSARITPRNSSSALPEAESAKRGGENCFLPRH